MTGAPIHALREVPPAERPVTPGASYGVPADGGELIPWQHVAERLRAADAYWLATVSPAGAPHVVPIWGVTVHDDLYLEIGAPETAKSRNLARNASIAVHLDDAGDAVIILGTAEPIAPGPSLGRDLAAAFHGKYAGYDPAPTDWAEGGLVRVRPQTILAWREMPTATRWRFGQGDGG